MELCSSFLPGNERPECSQTNNDGTGADGGGAGGAALILRHVSWPGRNRKDHRDVLRDARGSMSGKWVKEKKKERRASECKAEGRGESEMRKRENLSRRDMYLFACLIES